MKFYIAVAIAFVAAFGGISLAVRSVPALDRGAMVTLPASAATAQALDAGRDDSMRQREFDSRQRASAYDTDLNRIRHTTLQAAYAFMVAPCDPKNKARFIQATTDYAKAFISRTNCSLLSCSRDKLVATGAAFNTAEDQKVQRAIEEAFARGGVSASDFPVGRQMAMLGLIGPDNTTNSCVGGVQTRASR
jgi:hypothetical protein